jgi:hypothetical protein
LIVVPSPLANPTRADSPPKPFDPPLASPVSQLIEP